MKTPQLSLLISTYQRPWHLWRALLAVALQRGVEGKFELIVTDDGSTDETSRVVEAFARRVAFPVKFTTHENHGFRLARCRNEGVAVAAAPYLLFTDADCLLPPDHLATHLQWRRRGTVVAGDCYRLDLATSQRVTEQTVQNGEYLRWIPPRERLRLAKKGLCGRLTSLLRVPMRPRLTGCNIALWRDDYERVNGFDENFVGWGLEDRDLQLRLSRLGLRFRSIVLATAPCHLWHRPHPTFARNNEGTSNLCYYRRSEVPTRCRDGLFKEDGQERPDVRRHSGHEHLAGPHFPLRVPTPTPWEAAGAAIEPTGHVQHRGDEAISKPASLGHSHSHQANPRATPPRYGQRTKYPASRPRRHARAAATARAATSAAAAKRPESPPPGGKA